MIIDRSAAEGTVRLAPDGTQYQIDRNAGHARHLRNALAACVKAGRRANGGSRQPARGRHRGSASGLNATEARERARAQGIEAEDRGQGPAELIVKSRSGDQYYSPRS